MTDIGKAYVQIVPSADGISGSVKKILDPESTSAGLSAGKNIAGALGSALTKALSAIGIGKTIESAVKAAGNLEQSLGGLDTIYGDAADAAKEFANQAASAGISANDYAEQAVSFGASLKQAFSGDTKKAVEAANTAILDMADNSAKMGTDIGSLQNAYQGFAKQNYTMLDNLKLGYGGTKTEMERLLKDAQKISGVKYDIKNLGDVYEAIHIIQNELGLTGVAADEAKSTLTGSFGAMKASLQNFLASLALGQDIQAPLTELVNSAATFLIGNLAPMIWNIVKSVPSVFSTAIAAIAPQLSAGIKTVFEQLPGLLESGAAMVSKIVNGIVETAPQISKNIKAVFEQLPGLIESGFSIVSKVVNGILEAAPALIDAGMNIITSFVDGILTALPNVLNAAGDAITQFDGGLSAHFPEVLQKGVDTITNLVNGILSKLPDVIRAAGDLILKFASAVVSHFPEIVQKGIELVANLASGIINNLPAIVQAVVEVIAKFVATIGQNLPQILETGVNLIAQLVTGIIRAIPQVVSAIPRVTSAIVSGFSSFSWGSIGSNIIRGIANGITSGVGWIVSAAREAASRAFNAAKSWLGINSPSKLFETEIGRWIPAGIAQGISKNSDAITDAMNDASALTVSTFDAAKPEAAKGGSNVTVNVYGAEGQNVVELARIVADMINDEVNGRAAVYA